MLSGLPLVVLRPPGAGDNDVLDLLGSREVAGEWNWFDDPARDLFSAGALGGGALLVLDGGATVIGVVSYIQVPYGPNVASLAWRIGATILPGRRGRGYGAAAQRALAEQLLDTSAANRVEADTDTSNVPEQRALEKAGFSREGIVRGAQWRRGAWHDRVLYGILRADL